jgi:AraC-like DNA-binding protein
MEQEFKEGVRSSFTPIRVAWEIVELLEMASRPSEFKNKPDPAEVARNLIDQSLQCITDINTLSQGLNISRTTLFRLFKNRYGLSIKQYSEHVRFERIETLLRRRELPISEIARIGGFNDPLYFSRAFRKRYGKPPSQMYARPKKGAVVSQ